MLEGFEKSLSAISALIVQAYITAKNILLEHKILKFHYFWKTSKRDYKCNLK